MTEYVGPPLDRDSTAALLERLGVAPDRYHLSGAHIEDAVVLDQRGGDWVVFYSERGEELDVRVHPSQARACSDVVERLT